MRQHRYLLGLMIVFFFCDANRNVATAQDIPLFALHDWQWHNDEGWKALNNKAYAKAEERFKLAIKELMPYHPRSQRLLARSYCDLARALYHQERFADALPLAKWALAVREGDRKASDDVLFQNVYLAGLIELGLRHFGEAEPLLKRALTYQEKNLVASHVNMLTTLDKLAEAYREQGKYAEAEPLYLKAIAIHERKTPDENLELAATAEHYAILLAKLNRPDEAEKWKARALTIRDTVATKGARAKANQSSSKFQAFK